MKLNLSLKKLDNILKFQNIGLKFENYFLPKSHLINKNFLQINLDNSGLKKIFKGFFQIKLNIHSIDFNDKYFFIFLNDRFSDSLPNILKFIKNNFILCDGF